MGWLGFLATSGLLRTMYSVLRFGDMACDGVRMAAYARAIEETVKPGAVVVDIGAGTGIYSLLAARAGARRVHAVDPNPAIFLLPELAAENGYADRIVIHPISALDLELPEKADVIVSDLRGIFPLHAQHTEVIRDARKRLLAVNGTLLSTHDRLFVGLVEAPPIARRILRAEEGFERHGFKGKTARLSVLNTVQDDGCKPLDASDLISTGAQWAEVDYLTFEGGLVEGQADLTTHRPGLAHGLAIWFEATISETSRFNTAPGFQTAYGRTYLPLLEPVHLTWGDRIRVALRVDERGDRWAWETSIEDAAGISKAKHRQASFLGMPASAEALLRGSSTFKPTRSKHGSLVSEILNAMDGATSVGEIADRLVGAGHDRSRAHLIELVRDVVTQFGH